MKEYRKFQIGWLIVLIFSAIIVLIIIAHKYQWGNNPTDFSELVFLLVLLGGILLQFYGITILVSDKYITIRFGIGLFNKKIKLSSIKSIDIIKYPAYCGYGIRFIPNGVLYNVSGRHAIEIRLKEKKEVIQIGTNDWENLKIEIEDRINKKTGDNLTTES